MLTIRTFRPDEWPVYKSLRLLALEDSPDAFGSTYVESLKISDEQWMGRLKDVDTRFSFPVVALWDSEPAGLAWGRIEAANPERADLYEMWASPDYRGRGLGRGLLDAVRDWAIQQNATVLVLGVTIGNEAAARLYESAGFEAFGAPEVLRPGSEKMTINMRLDL